MSGRNEDLWQLYQHAETLRIQLDELHEGVERQFSGIMEELDALQTMCDAVFYESAKAYTMHSVTAELEDEMKRSLGN